MLHVYKASAGSGKTYSLTYFYLKICFDNLHDPRYFQHILAMTFTNDATAEMKSRIINELKFLAHGDPRSEHKERLMEKCGLADLEVQKAAESILQAMMQHYTRFSISTIDSFFQRVLKIFMRELKLEGGYEVELDSQKVLNEAMDNFLSGLEPDTPNVKWIEMILQQRMQENKGSNFEQDLLKLGGILFQEDLDQKLPSRSGEELREVYQHMNAEIYAFEGVMRQFAQEAEELLLDCGLHYQDFKGKSHSFMQKLIVKFADFREISHSDIDKVRAAENDFDQWYTKSCPDEIQDLIRACRDRVNDLLSRINRYLEAHQRDYYTLLEMRKNFPAFAFLTTLDEYIQEYCEQEQKILLTRTTLLLKKVIDFQIMPFFYERLGHRYHHILLDEFQDTSGTQWENLKVLVDHALSEQGMHSLIVGDVKQAIYRWRNGDWRTLQLDLDEEYGSRGELEHTPLKFNFRSLQNIINFNNHLFGFIPEAAHSYALAKWQDGVESSLTPDILKQVFAGHVQEVHEDFLDKKRGGYVQIGAIASGRNWTDEQEDFHWKLLKEQIIDIVDRGYDMRDICILVRKASEGRDIAEKLFEWQVTEEKGEHYFQCSSKEVLQLSSSLAVQAMIAFFKLIQDMDDSVARAEWVQAMQKLNGEPEAYDQFNKMPEELQRIIKNSRTQSLWEISDQVIDYAGLGIHKGEIPFIQHFQDEVLDFMQKEGGHIGDFLEWWEEKGYASAVVLPEGQNAIRIITIHKSKGLEFPVVLIPFANWEITELTALGYKQVWIWSRAFDLIGEHFERFPVNFSSKLEHTHFRDIYNNELVQQIVDNLNLLYVATTRAERELFLMLPKVESPDKPSLKSVGDLIFQSGQSPLEFEEKDASQEYFFWEMGSRTSPTTKSEKESPLISLTSYRAAKSIPPISGQFERADLEATEKEALSKGKAMHWMFEHIETEEDIETTLRQAIQLGIIEESESKDMAEQILHLFADENIGSLLKASGPILHEREILAGFGKVLRPDRVVLAENETHVIDFKTGDHYKKNEDQLKTYMYVLKDMGYINVKGYLLYLDKPELKEYT